MLETRWLISFTATIVVTGLLIGCSSGRKSTYVTTEATQITPEQQMLLDAEAAWALRDDKAQLQTAITKWEEYIAHDPNNQAVLGMLSRACYLLGAFHTTDKDEKLAIFDRGASFGERGMAANDAFRECVAGGKKDYKCLNTLTVDDILPTYWVYANMGKFSVTKGFSTVVANKSKLKAIADWVQATDPNFYYGAGDRILGTYYAKAPGFAGGDMGKSEIHFDASLQICPDYLGTKVLMAQYFATKQQDRELFERLLNEVLAADPEVLPEIAPEQRLEQKNAQRLLDQADDLF